IPLLRPWPASVLHPDAGGAAPMGHNIMSPNADHTPTASGRICLLDADIGMLDGGMSEYLLFWQHRAAAHYDLLEAIVRPDPDTWRWRPWHLFGQCWGLEEWQRWSERLQQRLARPNPGPFPARPHFGLGCFHNAFEAVCEEQQRRIERLAR